MFNLYEIIRSAHGGHALDNLATQFGITTEEADAAVKAVVPVLSEGFLKQASEPHAFGSFIGALGEGQHLAAFSDPAAAQATATAQAGGDILSQILTSRSAREEIALRASSGTGVSSDTLAKMLPVIASMIFGGLAKSMENQGFGGILGQLVNAAKQGIWPRAWPDIGRWAGFGQPAAAAASRAGSGRRAGGAPRLNSRPQIFGGDRSPVGPGQSPSAAPGPSGGRQAGLGGILGSILGNLTSRPGSFPGRWPGGGTRRAQRKPASAGCRCRLDPGGSRSPYQNAAAWSPAAHGAAKRGFGRDQ